MEIRYVLTMKEIKYVLKKRLKLIAVISLISMIGLGGLGLKPDIKMFEARAEIVVDKPISKEEQERANYDYLRFISAKNIIGPTELAKSQKIIKNVMESVDLNYNLKDSSKMIIVTNNLEASRIYINIKGINADKVNKILDKYTEVFLREAQITYSDTKFDLFSKENVESIEDSIAKKCIKFAVIGLIIGLFISSIIVFALEVLDKTVKTEEDLNELGLKVLTVIPNYTE